MVNSDLITTIQKYLDDVEGADADTPSVVKALRLATLELAAMPIVKHRLCPASTSTTTLVDGTSTYSLASDYNYNVSQVIYDSEANIGSQRELEYVTNTQMDDIQQSYGADIEYYTLSGTNIILGGIPSAGEAGKKLTIKYAGLPDVTLIQNDSVETLLGKKYPHVLIDMSIVRFLLTEPDLAPVADRYKTMVDEHKENIRQELETVSATGEFDGDVTGFRY